MAANVKGSGKYDYRVIESTDKICSIDFYQGKEKIGNSTFTEADAKKAGTKNQDKFPKNMLFARAISNGVKWFTPDVFSGPVYVPEEMEVLVTEDIKHEEVKQPAPTAAELQDAFTKLAECETKEQLTKLRKSLPDIIVKDASFIAAGKEKYNLIMAAQPETL